MESEGLPQNFLPRKHVGLREFGLRLAWLGLPRNLNDGGCNEKDDDCYVEKEKGFHLYSNYPIVLLRSWFCAKFCPSL